MLLALFLLPLESGSEAEKEEEEEEGRNTADACDDLTEEQPQSKNTEEDANSFSDGGLKADEQYNSKTYYIPSSTEFDCAMKKTRLASTISELSNYVLI